MNVVPYQSSEENGLILEAVANIQKTIGAIKKDAENPFFKSSYADLSTINAALKPILEEEGCILQYMNEVCEAEGFNVFRCYIVHVESGEYIVSSYRQPEGEDIQKEMGMFTYLRRYLVVAMLNLDTEEDDDGNSAASSRGGRKGKKKTTTKKKRGKRGKQDDEGDDSEEDEDEENEESSNEEDEQSFKKKRRTKKKSTKKKRKSDEDEDDDGEDEEEDDEGKGKKKSKKKGGRKRGF